MTEEFFDAVSAGDAAKVRVLIRDDPSLVNARTESGFSPVILAKYRGHENVVGVLLAAKPTLDVHEAASVGDLARVRDLVAREPGLVNTYSRDGYTPLGLAAYFGHREIVDFLIEQGAEVEPPVKNEMLYTALTGAVAEGHFTIAKALLDRGAAVNHRYAGGATPLLTAAANGDAEMVRLLLAYGADPTVANDEGKTATEMAAEGGHGEVVALLEGRSPHVVDREDPIRVGPEAYEVRLETDDVRVLMETLPPGGAIPRHRHPDHLLVAIRSGRIAIRSVHGRVETFEMEPGDVIRLPAETHEVENVGGAEWKAAIVEFKGSGAKQG